MRTKTKKILALGLATAMGTAGAHAARETFVRTGIKDGKALVVAAPVGNCLLREAFVNGKSTYISVSLTHPEQEDTVPTGLHVLTANGDVPVEMSSGKGAPGLSIVGGTFETSKLVSPVPVNPPTPGAAVYADTPEGSKFCGTFVVVPHAGTGPNQGRTVG